MPVAKKQVGKITVTFFESGDPDVEVLGNIDPGLLRTLPYKIQEAYTLLTYKKREEELKGQAEKKALIEKQREADAKKLDEDKKKAAEAAKLREVEIAKKKEEEKKQIEASNKLLEEQRAKAKNANK